MDIGHWLLEDEQDTLLLIRDTLEIEDLDFSEGANEMDTIDACIVAKSDGLYDVVDGSPRWFTWDEWQQAFGEKSIDARIAALAARHATIQARYNRTVAELAALPHVPRWYRVLYRVVSLVVRGV